MESQLSQDPLDTLIPPPDFSEPTTPELAHSSISESTTAAVSKLHSSRIDNAPSSTMTPPPSTQVPPSRQKTPTPPISHISTPPPTVELPADGPRGSRMVAAGLTSSMTADELDAATPDELRTKVVELQTALQEAKMSAAHHKLQYQMLSQESAAAIERMAVEARMEQKEDAVIYHAEQARAAATPVQQSPAYEGTIPVEKGLYQRMMHDLHVFSQDNAALRREIDQRDHMLDRQDNEIASLTDKVTLMRERIRENREHLNRYRRQHHVSSRVDSTPRSVYSTPHRRHASTHHHHQPQPFAALLQASEMASQESARSAHGRASGKKGHSRNTYSMSSLPTTPHRMQKVQQPIFHTPSQRQAPLKVPSTAPMPRTSVLRTPDIYGQSSLPVSRPSIPPAPQSDGTVSASDNDDNDSEAETDIIEQDEEVSESHASRAASQMLRSSQEQEAKRNSFKGSGMLERPPGDRFKQTKLSGTVRKANVDRDDERPAKRAKTGAPPVGLGIAGMRD